MDTLMRIVLFVAICLVPVAVAIARRARLVCEHLEEISNQGHEEYQPLPSILDRAFPGEL